MPKIPFDDDDGRFEAAEPPELSEAAKKALARQQKLDDANFITERTLQFQNDMAAEFARAKRDGDSADPMFVKDLMKFASEMRTEHLSDIPRGPRGRLISQDAIDLTRANMDGAMERFSTAALHRLNLERHQKAIANIGAAGAEIAAAAKRDAKGLSGLLSTVDDLLGQYEGVFADDEFKDQRARLRTGAVIAAIDGLIERRATGDARALVTGGAFDADLGPKPARLLLGRIDKTEKDNALLAALEAADAREVAVADLDLRAATGQAFREELDFELEQGTISPEEHADLMAELERFNDDRAGRIEGIERVNNMLARREKPDADDPTDRAAVDVVFESLARAFAEHPPEDKASIEDDYVARTGRLPAALRDTLIGGMLSEDPAAQVAAAGRLVAFEDADPVLIAEIPDDTLTRARMIEAYAYPGLPPARIVQLAAEKVARAAKRAGPGSIEGDDGEGATSARTKGTDRQRSSIESRRRTRAQQTPSPTITKVQATQAGKPSATSQIKNPASKFWDGVLTRLLKREGGYNPRDPSNRGIKADTLKNFLKRKGRPARSKKELMDKLRKLTENEARQIYREDFIEEAELARIPDRGFAEQVLDGVVNHGRENGIVQLQNALNKVLKGNLDLDGKLGPRTEKAIQDAITQGRLTELGKQLVKEREDFIDKSTKIRAREKPVLKRRAQEVGPK